jgi:SAM-dependent methyltransferase
MLPNESRTIRLAISALPPSCIAVIGSATESYYKEMQPYIWNDIYEPFQGIHQFVNFEIKEGPGIDVVIRSIDYYEQYKEKFDLVLANSLLEHTENPKELVHILYGIVKKDGAFLFSSPGEWPYNEDPIDNMLRFDSVAKWRAMLPPLYDIKSFLKLEPVGPGYTTMVVCRRTR